jgi:hypothetical protein
MPLITPRRSREPSDTQDWVSREFGRPSKKHAEQRARKADIDDLKRVPGSKDFRRDNPDADIHDWERYQRQKREE